MQLHDLLLIGVLLVLLNLLGCQVCSGKLNQVEVLEGCLLVVVSVSSEMVDLEIIADVKDALRGLRLDPVEQLVGLLIWHPWAPFLESLGSGVHRASYSEARR